MNTHFDITKAIISPAYVMRNIGSIFPDSVFLDHGFSILGMSQNLAQQLEYSAPELSGKCISTLDKTGTLKGLLRLRLMSGFFTDENIQITKRSGETAIYSVSGFYLGMLTDSNVIVLRFHNKKEVEDLNKKLQQSKHQIDHFIYRTAHDLRGPLATIQGLVHLLKIREDDTELDYFIQLIDAHSKKLDERLAQLVYLAQVEEELEHPTFELTFPEIETEMRKIIEKNAFVDFLELSVASPLHQIKGYNEILIRSIMCNVLLYILTIPRCGARSTIHVDAREVNRILTIRIQSQGFGTDPEMETYLNNVSPSRYTDVLKSSKFTCLFAAQKIAVQLHALITIDVIDHETHELCISIPATK